MDLKFSSHNRFISNCAQPITFKPPQKKAMVRICENLHNMTHVDHHFQHVDNTFICPSSISDIWGLNTTSYQQSIQMFAIVSISFGLIYFVISSSISTIYCCYKYCKKRNNQLQEEQLLAENSINPDSIGGSLVNQVNNNSPATIPITNRNNNNAGGNIVDGVNQTQLKLCASVSQYLLTLISLCLIICSACFLYEFNSTIQDVQTNWDNSYESYDTCINYGLTIESILTAAVTECENIKNVHFPSYCQDAVIIIDQMETTLKDSLNDMNRFLSDGEVISWGDSSQVDAYRKYFLFIGASLQIFIAILIVFSLIQMYMQKCIYCNTLLCFILVFSMLLIWIISSIQFAFSVEVSDACANPQNSILQGINVTNDANIDENTLDIVKYYIYCDEFYTYNPLQNYTQSAYNELISINNTIHQILAYSSLCNITNQTEILLNYYTQTLTEFINVENALKCNDINGYLTNITSDLCEKSITYWYLLYLFQTLVVILLVTKSYCICTKNEINSDDKDDIQNVYDDIELSDENSDGSIDSVELDPDSKEIDITYI